MKRKKPLPKAAVPALIGVGGILVLLVGWMLVISPQGKKAASLKQQAAAVEQQIADNLAQAAAAKSATAAPTIRVADVYKLAKAMPSITDMPDILLELGQTAKAAGVSLQTISPSPPTPAGSGYQTVAISVNATGDFYAMTDLLYRLRNLVWVRNGALEASGRLFSVKSLTLSPSGSSVVATLGLLTYVYGGGAGATAAPPPATSTSTGTTGTTTTTATTTPSSGPSAAGAP